MSTQIKTFSSLEELREILKIHDEAWNHSHGILDLLKNSSECFIIVVDNENMAGYPLTQYSLPVSASIWFRPVISFWPLEAMELRIGRSFSVFSTA